MNQSIKQFEREIVVNSSTDNLSLIRDFTKNLGEQSGVSREVLDKIILAVDEACTNIIKHAYSYRPDGEITINIKIENSKFIISITDNGLHFNPDLVPEPDIKEFHKQKKSGGLGVFLMRKLMDEVNYSNTADKRNQVVLIKYLS